MLYRLRGSLIHTEPSFAVIECAGVGYKCYTTMNTQRSLPAIGKEAVLYTHMNVREDAVDLFGFSSLAELNCFKLLTSVSGVGPKVGLAILSVLSPEQVAVAVAAGDFKTLTMAQGVGNKLAQRVILELKDKLKALGGGEEVTAADRIDRCFKKIIPRTQQHYCGHCFGNRIYFSYCSPYLWRVIAGGAVVQSFNGVSRGHYAFVRLPYLNLLLHSCDQFFGYALRTGRRDSR